jgi:opacity protein-like surface antigen
MKRNRKHIGCKTLSSLAAIACAGSLAPVAALGQGAAEFEAVDLHTPYAKTHVIPGFGYRTEADIDDGGSFSEMAFSVRGGPGFTLSEDLHLYALGSYRFTHYDFQDVSDDPDNFHTFRATPVLRWTMDDAWTIYGGPSIGFSAQEGADFGDSVTYGALAGVSYKVHDALSVGGGLGIFSRIEDDVRIIPFITANWDMSEQFNLRVGFTEVAASGGLGAEVTYDLNDQFVLGGGIQFQEKRYRIEAGDGVLNDKSMPIYAKVGWRMSENMLFEFQAGVAVGGEILLEDDSGNEILEEDYDPAAIFGVRAVFNF